MFRPRGSQHQDPLPGRDDDGLGAGIGVQFGENGVQLNDSLASAIARVAPSVVRVEGRRGAPSSGIAWSSDGLVVAASHAVGRGDSGVVVDEHGHRLEVALVGRDPATDVAVLRGPADALPPPAFSSADDLAVGHLVLALGRPGRVIRASLRIVGLLADEVRLPRGGRLERVIEMDRGFPPGFVGGPLVDVAGQVVGMGTDMALRGADLAIPPATLARVVDAIVTHGRIRRGWLGVRMTTAKTPEAVRTDGGPEDAALIVAVDPEGGAARSGIQVGDLLLEVDGRPVTDAADLAEVLADRPDTSVPARRLRGGDVEELTLQVGSR